MEDKIARNFGLSDSLAMHRPGFRRVTDAAALDRVAQAYLDADIADVNRWRHGLDATGEFIGQREGDRAGHLRKVSDKLECVGCGARELHDVGRNLRRA